jgi:ABC-type spermidine/putrescine transport system permease subunit II
MVGLPDSALAQAAPAALLAAVVAVAAGLLVALAAWRAGRWWQLAAAGGSVLLAMAPSGAPLEAAVAQGGALTVLIVLAGLMRVPAGLVRAARLAGARPLQAWRHAVLAPLLPHLALAGLAALSLAFVHGPAAALMLPRNGA